MLYDYYQDTVESLHELPIEATWSGQIQRPNTAYGHTEATATLAHLLTTYNKHTCTDFKIKRQRTRQYSIDEIRSPRHIPPSANNTALKSLRHAQVDRHNSFAMLWPCQINETYWYALTGWHQHECHGIFARFIWRATRANVMTAFIYIR